MPKEKIIIDEVREELPEQILIRQLYVPNPNYADELIEEIKNG